MSQCRRIKPNALIDGQHSKNMAQDPVKCNVLIIRLISIGHGAAHFFHLILPPLFPWIKAEFDLSNAQHQIISIYRHPHRT